MKKKFLIPAILFSTIIILSLIGKKGEFIIPICISIIFIGIILLIVSQIRKKKNEKPKAFLNNDLLKQESINTGYLIGGNIEIDGVTDNTCIFIDKKEIWVCERSESENAKEQTMFVIPKGLITKIYTADISEIKEKITDGIELFTSESDIDVLLQNNEMLSYIIIEWYDGIITRTIIFAIDEPNPKTAANNIVDELKNSIQPKEKVNYFFRNQKTISSILIIIVSIYSAIVIFINTAFSSQGSALKHHPVNNLFLFAFAFPFILWAIINFWASFKRNDFQKQIQLGMRLIIAGIICLIITIRIELIINEIAAISSNADNFYTYNVNDALTSINKRYPKAILAVFFYKSAILLFLTGILFSFWNYSIRLVKK